MSLGGLSRLYVSPWFQGFSRSSSVSLCHTGRWTRNAVHVGSVQSDGRGGLGSVVPMQTCITTSLPLALFCGRAHLLITLVIVTDVCVVSITFVLLFNS